MNNKFGIILFTKVPKAGFVKTRLQHPQLDEDFISNLQAAMIKDTLLMLEKISTNFIPILSFFPKESRKIFGKLIIKPLQTSFPKIFENINMIPQIGNTVAERFSNVFSLAFNKLKLDSVIIIGSDTPHLQPNLIIQSFKLLQEHRKAAVLGPSQNGGFYILGHNKPFITNIGSIFQKKSTYKEIGNVMDLLRLNGYLVHLLPEVTDVDTFENLKTVRIIIKLLSLTSSESITSYFPRFTFQTINSLPNSTWN